MADELGLLSVFGRRERGKWLQGGFMVMSIVLGTAVPLMVLTMVVVLLTRRTVITLIRSLTANEVGKISS